MAEYEAGKMDISEQVHTYNAFWGWTVRVCVTVAVILALLYLFRT